MDTVISIVAETDNAWKGNQTGEGTGRWGRDGGDIRQAEGTILTSDETVDEYKGEDG